MKKIIFAIALVVTMGFVASAQRKSDGFFNTFESVGNRADMSNPNDLGLGMPNTDLGSDSNSDAPLGNGLLILTAIGAGYAVARKRKNKKTTN